MSRVFFFLLATVVVAAAQPAPVPADQLAVAGNACGPTALLNAFRFGNESWQRAATAVPGETSKQQITAIIRQRGLRPSRHLQGRLRWSTKGVNLADLTDIANEMTRGHYLPQVREETLFRTPRESQRDLLKRVHSRCKTSLAKGLPPVVSLRRYVRRNRDGAPPQWIAVEAHFVTIIDIPKKLEKSANGFPVTYIDPWGGKIRHGTIEIPARGILTDDPDASPCLAAEFPDAAVGKKLVRSGESTALTIAAMLGRW